MQGLGTIFGLTTINDMILKSQGYKGPGLTDVVSGQMSGLLPEGEVQDFGSSFINLFAGKGLKSNAELAGAGGAVTVNGDLNITSAGTTAEAVFEDARRLVRATARTASPVG